MLPWLKLLRLPNVFTAMADVMMGYLFVHPSLQPLSVFGLLLGSSISLYLAGMVLNDVFDLKQDSQERPERPLPSGQISLATAKGVGFGLLGTGVAMGWLVSAVSHQPHAITGWLSTMLAALVFAYDAILKRSFAGPAAMGGCRFFNVLLGMSTGSIAGVGSFSGFDSSQLAIAGGIGLYVAGVTWFARQEAARPAREGLIIGVVLMLVGFTLLAVFPRVGAFAAGTRSLTFRSDLIWVLLLVGLGVPLLRRCVTVIARPTAKRVQIAVKSCIVSVIVIDAAVCLAVRVPWWWSACILALLVPMLWLGRWVYST